MSRHPNYAGRAPSEMYTVTHGGRPYEKENSYFKFKLRDGIPSNVPAQVTPRQSDSDGVHPYDLRKILSRSRSTVKHNCEPSFSSTESDRSCPPYHIGSDFPPPWVEETDYRQYLGALPDESNSADLLSTPFIGSERPLLGNTQSRDRNFDVEDCAQAREDRWRDNDVKRFAEIAQYLDHTALQTLAAPEPASPFSNYPGETPPLHPPTTSEYKYTYSEPTLPGRQYPVPSINSYLAETPPLQQPPSTTEYKYLPSESLQPAARQYRPQSVTNYLAQSSSHLQQPPPTATTTVRQQRPQSANNYIGRLVDFQQPLTNEFRHSISEPAPSARQYHTSYGNYSGQTAAVQPLLSNRPKFTYSDIPQRTTKQRRPSSASNLSGLLIQTSSTGYETRAPPRTLQHNYSAPSQGSTYSSKQPKGHRESNCAVAEYLGKVNSQRNYRPSPNFEPQPPSSAPGSAESNEQQPQLSEEQQQQLIHQQQLEKETSRRRFEAFANHLEHTYPLTGSRVQPPPSGPDFTEFADINQFLEERPLDDLPTADMYHQPNAFEENPTMLRRSAPVGALHHPSQLAFQQYQRPEEQAAVYRFSNSSGEPSSRIVNGGMVNGGMANGGMVNGGMVNQMAMSEKKELHELNNRLSVVLQSQQPPEGRFDATSLLNAVDSLEQELSHVRTTYDQELGKIRQEVKELSRSRAEYELETRKLKSLASDLENRLGRASGPEGQHLDMPVGPIEQTNHHPVTEAFTDPKLTERHQQQNRVMSTPGDVTNDYKHYSSCAAPPPGPPPNNKGRIRARSAPVSRGHPSLTYGQGNDYFDEMFQGLKKGTQIQQMSQASSNASLPRGVTGMSPTPPSSAECKVPSSQSVSICPSATDHTPFDQEPYGPAPPGSNLVMGNGVMRRNVAAERPVSTSAYDYTKASASSTGFLEILEVNQDGKYIRLVNTSADKNVEFGDYMLKQQVGGHPVSVYRFPPRMTIHPRGMITVWSGQTDPLQHQPPNDFVFQEQQRWGTGPECTTILCKPNGQAVAWITAAHRFTPDVFDGEHQKELAPSPIPLPIPVDMENLADYEKEGMRREILPEYDMDVNAARPEPVYLHRRKATPPSLNAQKHPHGANTHAPVHPNSGLNRPRTYGNDNSSMNRQSRSQGTRPDPVPGAPYAGAAGQKMGSALLKRYQAQTIRGSGGIANRAVHYGFEMTSPPSAFQTPRARFNTGLQQVQSQHNLSFQPPLPKPPLFSVW